MTGRKYWLLGAAAFAFILTDAAIAQRESLVHYVDPHVGLGNDDEGDTVAGPARPAGSIHPSPEMLSGSNAGYDPAADISGFAQLHTQGSGGRTTYGTFLLSPQTGDPVLDEASHLSPKSGEEMGADRYAVTLDRYGVRAEVTPGHHAAIYRFAYPAGKQATLVFDITRKIGGVLASDGADVRLIPERGRLIGRVRSKDYWSPANVDIWFVAQIDRPLTAWGVRAGDRLLPGAVDAQVPADTKLNAWWQFDGKGPVEVKVAVSFTSAERAGELLDAELAGKHFADVQADARAEWDRELNRATIDGVGDADKRRYYTALYHSVIQPRDRTLDQPVADRTTPHWDDYYTLWDTYRTAFPLMSLLRPSVYAGNVASIIATYRRYGAAHTAFIAGRNYHVGQGGDEVDNVLGEGLIRRVPGVDWKAAADVAIHNALEERRPRYLIDGWFGVGDNSPETDNPRARSGSSTIGYALNDFYAAGLAEAAGRKDLAAMLQQRSGNWRHVWDKDVQSDGFAGFIAPRYPDGRFQPNDPKLGWDGKTYNNVGFYEGTGWIYSYDMLHDLPGMIAAMGGRDRFIERLDHALNTGLIDITNEPSFATPWLFSEVGRPDLASFWANRIFTRFTANAYPGDEDNGAMSSHYVFNRLGLFPKLTTDHFYLHAPHQPRAVLNLENGRSFTIKAPNWKPGRIYISAARLNGKPIDRAFLRQEEIMAGGTLELQLASKPNKWGQDAQ
ncbi:GH92 family glycosyl hydrolase [Sphingobium sp. BYY-5]|uniref:GH92 family glycosyl hydrolase n=1 Tax=Sphingobium sp. BYY-5 TaxID=2926400 RepID=UPI001FA72DEF|nr:GH92 family glycosyl hydrolase [Sphingobium sp. BYY-5]MCI4590731.1 GH92 family glycosyl hydrolase [Sphingobium sp. BYY-5]